ncbi:MAG: hypothetical protein ACO1NZ_06585 [Adhaeribacter sp.]
MTSEELAGDRKQSLLVITAFVGVFTNNKFASAATLVVGDNTNNGKGYWLKL